MSDNSAGNPCPGGNDSSTAYARARAQSPRDPRGSLPRARVGATNQGAGRFHDDLPC
jgi:hypothetical protein